MCSVILTLTAGVCRGDTRLGAVPSTRTMLDRGLRIAVGISTVFVRLPGDGTLLRGYSAGPLHNSLRAPTRGITRGLARFTVKSLLQYRSH